MMYVSNGDEPNPAIAFLPANAHARGLAVFENTAYAATVNGCGGVADGVWALDIESKKVNQWKAANPVVGSFGYAVGPEGAIYVSSGSEIVELEERTLAQKSAHKAGGKLSSSPLVFDFKGRTLIAAVSADGKLVVADGASMGGPAVAESAAVAAPGTGALASWQDAAGTRWILAPTTNGIGAWKLVENGGSLAFETGWKSREMVSPLAPAIINGVVFAIAGGNRSARATVYALDGLTGKELWNSGNTITGMVRTGGLAGGGTRVYAGGTDGTQYAFGFPIEH